MSSVRPAASSPRPQRPLEVIARLGPPMGHPGTVVGPIEAFDALEVAGVRTEPTLLTGGIVKALTGSAAGAPPGRAVTAAAGRTDRPTPAGAGRRGTVCRPGGAESKPRRARRRPSAVVAPPVEERASAIRLDHADAVRRGGAPLVLDVTVDAATGGYLDGDVVAHSASVFHLLPRPGEPPPALAPDDGVRVGGD